MEKSRRSGFFFVPGIVDRPVRAGHISILCCRI